MFLYQLDRVVLFPVTQNDVNTDCNGHLAFGITEFNYANVVHGY